MAAKPRWVAKIIEALAVPENKGKIVYQVATVDSHNAPHVRTQVHRGFIFPKHALNLPLMVTSSDVRAPKVVQLLSNTAVELAWWMEGSQDQFRISGKARVVAPPDHSLSTVSGSETHSAVIAALNKGGEAEREDGSDGLDATSRAFDWEKKRRDVFDDMKPGMKGTWVAPKAPGSPMASYDEPNSWRCTIPKWEEIKTDEERKNYQIALGNFAMILIEPLEVDWVQLGEHPNRRTLFTRKDEQGGSSWQETIVVP